MARMKNHDWPRPKAVIRLSVWVIIGLPSRGPKLRPLEHAPIIEKLASQNIKDEKKLN